MSGLSVAIDSWQIMHVLTLGSPAIGPFVTLSWQYSVQVRPLAMCVLCGNGIGCTAVGRMPKKSRVASDSVARAGVNTASVDEIACGGGGLQATAASTQAATMAALKGC